jgi:hypothetical protein
LSNWHDGSFINAVIVRKTRPQRDSAEKPSKLRPNESMPWDDMVYLELQSSLFPNASSEVDSSRPHAINKDLYLQLTDNPEIRKAKC